MGGGCGPPPGFNKGEKILKQLGEFLNKDLVIEELLELKYDCGDSRSYGRFGATLKVAGVGEVKLVGFKICGTSGLDMDIPGQVYVNDSEVDCESIPELEIPHFNAGVNTVNRWEETGRKNLVNEFTQWLAGEYEECTP